MDQELLRAINSAYSRLETKQAQIVHALRYGEFAVECGWYNGHYRQNENGDWSREAYPIPVVEVKGVCDIEISFDTISVSTRLTRAKALEYSYDKVLPYSFEAFGVDDYLCDYYKCGMSVAELKANLSRGEEKEIGFAFSFPFAAGGEEISALAALLRREGFYCG